MVGARGKGGQLTVLIFAGWNEVLDRKPLGNHRIEYLKRRRQWTSPPLGAKSSMSTWVIETL